MTIHPTSSDTTPDTAPDTTPPPRALLIVDVQPTFCEEGELPVSGGNDTAFRIADHLRDHREDYVAIITSQDWHIDPAEHFSDTPDFVDTWPPHGLAGSPNAQLHPAVAAALGEHGADIAVKKGQHAAAYSAFDGTDDDGVALTSLLARLAVTDLDVCGIAESHCVRASAEDALRLGLGVRLLTELTVPVTPESGAAARAAIVTAGGVLL
ncbi:isochorismatase family protein [Jatrophihabitans telluris]|uniref:nicotinamidase n=1 Tax=Jatrophihabitans telluris TaxID=2038343 RepID=A0ABY4QZB0_9ACTN|nr:isochorismatase family protein [Jatrophihabitans telluris]UQX88840.1 isochorismatase family protein [Jatrophihabitans telluris]